MEWGDTKIFKNSDCKADVWCAPEFLTDVHSGSVLPASGRCAGSGGYSAVWHRPQHPGSWIRVHRSCWRTSPPVCHGPASCCVPDTSLNCEEFLSKSSLSSPHWPKFFILSETSWSHPSSHLTSLLWSAIERRPYDRFAILFDGIKL